MHYNNSLPHVILATITFLLLGAKEVCGVLEQTFNKRPSS